MIYYWARIEILRAKVPCAQRSRARKVPSPKHDRSRARSIKMIATKDNFLILESSIDLFIELLYSSPVFFPTLTSFKIVYILVLYSRHTYFLFLGQNGASLEWL